MVNPKATYNDTISLLDFQISPKTGFMPAIPPLTRLPGQYFASWEDLILELPQLIKNKQLRKEVHKLPKLEFNSTTLQSEEEWKRAYSLLCFLGNGYIWMDGQKGIIYKIPQKIAIPWCTVSDHLQLKPVICYCASVLYNYRLRDPQEPWSLDNLHAILTFTGTEDESWFYMITAFIELTAVPTLRAIEHVFHDMSCQRDTAVQKFLQTMQQSLSDMRKILNKMAEGCRPATFYLDIRPFQAGSKGLDVFPQGILFEGVSSEPKQLSGASAGQSSVVRMFDIILGAKHFGPDKEFLDAMLQYMPIGHRRFLEMLQQMPSVHDYCKRSGNTDLIACFNCAVQALTAFRTDHLILVTRYIVNQKSISVNPSLNKKGSGGTDFMQFLKKVRDDSLQLLISHDS